MKKTKAEQVVRVETTLVECICNACGDEMAYGDFKYKELIKRHAVTVKVEGGYYNDKIPDCTVQFFDLCEDCLINFVSTFKIKLAETNYLAFEGPDSVSEPTQDEEEV
jgi:hypothetical protein